MALMKCPECSKSISSAAPACPGCGLPLRAEDGRSELIAPTGNKTPQAAIRTPFRIMLGFIVAILAVAFWFSSTHPDAQTSAAPIAAGHDTQVQAAASPVKPVPPSRPIYRTSAHELYKDYSANEVAEDDRIGGAVVEVSGEVAAIDKDFKDSAVVRLRAGDGDGTGDLDDVTLTMVESDKPVAAKLSKGQWITVRCLTMKRIVSEPIGDDCTFVRRTQ